VCCLFAFFWWKTPIFFLYCVRTLVTAAWHDRYACCVQCMHGRWWWPHSVFAACVTFNCLTPTLREVRIKLRRRHAQKISSWYEGVSKSFWTESITKYMPTFAITRLEATQRVMAAKLTRLTHRIAIQLHLVAERSTICSSRSRRPFRKLLDTPSYVWCIVLIIGLFNDSFQLYL
jgi:hypothetical protein